MRVLLPLVCAIAAGCQAAPHTAKSHEVRGAKDLVRMDRCQLESLYKQSEAANLPCGSYDGRAIINAGSPMTVPTSRVVHLMWQGKVITDGGQTMVNRVFGPFRAVRANVYMGESWIDGKPALILDYEGRSKVFGAFRDEVREVSPGLYLGATHERTPSGPEFKTFFTLDSRGK